MTTKRALASILAAVLGLPSLALPARAADYRDRLAQD